MINTSVVCHRLTNFTDLRICITNSSLDCLPRPIPANECIVLPPMLSPAIPVDAVTAIPLTWFIEPWRLRNVSMIASSKQLFPVPLQCLD